MSDNAFTKKDFLNLLDDMLPDEPYFYGFSVKIGINKNDNENEVREHMVNGLEQLKKQFMNTDVTITQDFFPRTLEIKVNA